MNEQTSEHVSAVAPSGVARLIAHVKAMAPVRTAVVHPCDALSLGGAESAGIVMGARVPIVLTSRSDSRTTRLASCAIALMLAERRRAAPP